jgi:hypothetical protein
MNDGKTTEQLAPMGLAEAAFTSAGLMSLAGVLSGLFWGGLGGRIAMRILLLTSPDNVRGVISDDGFEIGKLSSESIVLFIFAAVLGGIIGFGGGLVRMVTAGPTWLIASGFGLACGPFFGALLVTPDGVDFQLLEPLGLAVVLFVALPGLWGSTTVVLAEYLAQPGIMFDKPLRRLNERRLGFLGWGLLGLLTVVGVVGLAVDVRELASS